MGVQYIISKYMNSHMPNPKGITWYCSSATLLEAFLETNHRHEAVCPQIKKNLPSVFRPICDELSKFKPKSEMGTGIKRTGLMQVRAATEIRCGRSELNSPPLRWPALRIKI